MRSTITFILALTILALQSAMAAKVNVTVSATILEPVTVSMKLSQHEAQIDHDHAKSDTSFETNRDYHFMVSYNSQDTCSYIDTNSQTISNNCSTATLNFN